MTNRWQRHGIAVLMTWTVALAACDGGSGARDILPDVLDDCGCPDLGKPDVTTVTDVPGIDTPAPGDLPGTDVPIADLPQTDAPPPDIVAIDAPSPDVPPPTDALPGDDSPADLPGVDVPQPDLPAPDAVAEDVPVPQDPGPPPATLGVVSPADLLAELDHKDFLLINVHVPYAGQIPGTDTNLTYLDVDAIAAYIGADLDTKAVVYCMSNYMSGIAGNALVAKGYRAIRYLDGGMGAWKNAGYPFEAP